MQRRASKWAYLWASPWSAFGLLLGALAWCGGANWRRIDGTLEIDVAGRRGNARRRRGVPRFGAITFGHVILGLDSATLAALRSHEQVHVRQYERWGVLFVPLYLVESAWQGLRGASPYRDNRFECQARAASVQPRA